MEEGDRFLSPPLSLFPLPFALAMQASKGSPDSPSNSLLMLLTGCLHTEQSIPCDCKYSGFWWIKSWLLPALLIINYTERFNKNIYVVQRVSVTYC